MTSPSDVVRVPESPSYATPPAELAPREDVGAMSLYQEINARRARVENSELLQHLRGL